MRETKIGTKLVVIYTSVVITCLVIGFAGDQDPLWLLAAFFLTLPWSLVLAPYMWSLIHGALGGHVGLYFVACGAVNAFMIYTLGNAIGKGRDKETR
jgi:hypothetical protein